MKDTPLSHTPLLIVTAAWMIGIVLSGYAPHDRLTWLMEVVPVLIALPLLWTIGRRFVFSDLVYGLILFHGLVLILGGAYTYARVPPGFWVQDWLGLDRNPYDRFAHLIQGFVPAFIARELLLRRFALPRGPLLGFLVVCICLAISASYEIIEWGAALIMGGSMDAFLGTQGDPWDTQADMGIALVGAAATLANNGERRPKYRDGPIIKVSLS